MTRRRGQYRNPKFVHTDWQERAACFGSKVDFVPEDNDLQSEMQAKRICFACPVLSDCLGYALHHRDPGVWGGMTLAERLQYSGNRSVMR